ncbi:unnamed protein product [Brugia pahangi]|uniref:Uncharacterized protein n=1 Tax=Brugia pahangi TaxID=6280 RepID=A0A0N4TGB2_BRUPA|nr:unnamed protein product [Brugia pahangi]
MVHWRKLDHSALIRMVKVYSKIFTVGIRLLI